MVLGKFAVRAPIHYRIRKCLQKADTLIHIFQQNEPICSHCKLATNIMRRTINVLISPWSGRMRCPRLRKCKKWRMWEDLLCGYGGNGWACPVEFLTWWQQVQVWAWTGKSIQKREEPKLHHSRHISKGSDSSTTLVHQTCKFEPELTTTVHSRAKKTKPLHIWTKKISVHKWNERRNAPLGSAE